MLRSEVGVGVRGPEVAGVGGSGGQARLSGGYSEAHRGVDVLGRAVLVERASGGRCEVVQSRGQRDLLEGELAHWQ